VTDAREFRRYAGVTRSARQAYPEPVHARELFANPKLFPQEGSGESQGVSTDVPLRPHAYGRQPAGACRFTTASGGVADPAVVVLLAALMFPAPHRSSNVKTLATLLRMTGYALLLRGINVGGNNRVAMADLRKLLVDLGYENPKTLLNSGNAIIQTDHKADEVERRVQEAINSELGLAIETLARTHAELQKIVETDPFKGVATDPSRYAVAFLRSAPESEGLETFNAVNAETYAPDVWQLIGRELYLWYPNGQATTKLTGPFWEKKLKVTVTARNWNTLIKLRDLTADPTTS
jgi:uncharacterized protein (DUF1697 family)